MLSRFFVFSFVCLAVCQAQEAESVRVPLHPVPWTSEDEPMLGTYVAGEPVMENLQGVADAGIRVIVGYEGGVDLERPMGRFCHENGIKIIYHLSHHVYHGVKLREAITADQTTIPLHMSERIPGHDANIIQLDDERIRYESVADGSLVGCERGYDGTTPAPHHGGIILFWPEPCAEEVARIKDSPNLYGYYVLDDSPGDALSALRAMYKVIRSVDPDINHPICAGYGDPGALINFGPGVCDIMMIYWYPVSSRDYFPTGTGREVQRMLTRARSLVPGIPFAGIFQAFDGRPAKTGQSIPTPEQLRKQLEDFVREGASGLIAFITRAPMLPGWLDHPELAAVMNDAFAEIRDEGGLLVPPESPEAAAARIQPQGHWTTPRPVPGGVTAWHVLGAFDSKDDMMLDTPGPADETVDLDAAYETKFGTARWRIRETTGGALAFTSLYGQQQTVAKCFGYAYCQVTSPEEQQVVMHLTSDDDAWVKFNGEEIYRHDGQRGINYNLDKVEITLPAGTSTLLAKVYNRGGLWSLLMEFRDPGGNRIDNLTFE